MSTYRDQSAEVQHLDGQLYGGKSSSSHLRRSKSRSCSRSQSQSSSGGQSSSQSSGRSASNFSVGINSEQVMETMRKQRQTLPRKDNKLCVRCFKRWDGQSIESLPCCIFPLGSRRRKCQYCSDQRSRCIPVSNTMT